MIFDSIRIILEQFFLYFPLILGSYISISLIKVPDLSIEGAFVFGAIVAAKCVPFVEHMPHGLALLCILACSMLGGMCVGIISSILTKIAKVPHLLSSILTLGLFHGINQWVLGTSLYSLSSFRNVLMYCPDGNAVGSELLMLTGIFMSLVLLGYIILRSQLGYAFGFYGNNPHFFEHYGISSTFIFIMGIVLSNALAGLSGFCIAQSSGFVDVNAGGGVALFCVTCLVLGKAIRGAYKNIALGVPLLGGLAYCIIQQGLLLVGFNLKYFTMIQSGIVLAVLMHSISKQGRRRFSVDNLGV